MRKQEQTRKLVQATRFEKDITEFLNSLPANDNISGVGFMEIDDAANSNTVAIDEREIGVDVPTVSIVDDFECVSIGYTEISETVRALDFSDEGRRRRGFLAED